MAHAKDKQVKQNVDRIVGWLVEHRAEFEQAGVEENRLASHAGISEKEVATAVDYLENHEDVVRWPGHLDKEPRIMLKPGRGWANLRDKVLGSNPQ